MYPAKTRYFLYYLLLISVEPSLTLSEHKNVL